MAEPKVRVQAARKINDYQTRVWYGVDESPEESWTEKLVEYKKPVTRSRAEALAEYNKLRALGVYGDDLK